MKVIEYKKRRKYSRIIDWAKMKYEYVNSGVILTDLAKKYNISNDAIFRVSAKEKWVEQKEKRSQSNTERIQLQMNKREEKGIDEIVDQRKKDLEALKTLKALAFGKLIVKERYIDKTDGQEKERLKFTGTEADAVKVIDICHKWIQILTGQPTEIQKIDIKQQVAQLTINKIEFLVKQVKELPDDNVKKEMSNIIWEALPEEE